MLFRLAYLGVTNTLALLRLLQMSDPDKDAEILALRHQITVLERQLHGEKVRFTPADRAWLAALLHRLPRDVLRNLRLLVRPETVLRWHRGLIARRHARASLCRARTLAQGVSRHFAAVDHDAVYGRSTRRRCQDSRVAGVTMRCFHSSRGRARTSTASTARAGQDSRGLPTCRRSTATS